MLPNYRVFVAAMMVGFLAVEGRCADVRFRDDFNQSTLGAGWTIIRPDPSTYSLTMNPGFFRILTVRGLLGEEGTAKNLLVRPTSGDFILDTRLEFDPRDGQPFAGLLVYQDDAHAVSIGLVYAAGDRGVFRGVVMLNVGDNVDANNRPASKYDESNVMNPGVIYLRLLRQGDRFVGAFSDDGVAYRELGTVSNVLNTQLSVGIGAANGDSESCGAACDVPIPALFDYFQISELDGSGPTVQATLESVDMEGPSQVASGGSGTFSATAHYNDGSSDDVSDVAQWIVAPPETGSIQDGVFNAASTSEDQMATVVVTYTQNNETGPITRTSARLVRIVPTASGVRSCGAGTLGFAPLAFLSLAWRGIRERNRRSIEG